MNIVSKKLKQSGQGMTEYIIIVALIAVAAIAVTQLFGATIRNQMAGIAQEVAGKNASAELAQAKTASGKAATAAKTNNTLADFNNQGGKGAQ